MHRKKRFFTPIYRTKEVMALCTCLLSQRSKAKKKFSSLTSRIIEDTCFPTANKSELEIKLPQISSLSYRLLMMTSIINCVVIFCLLISFRASSNLGSLIHGVTRSRSRDGTRSRDKKPRQRKAKERDGSAEFISRKRERVTERGRD